MILYSLFKQLNSELNKLPENPKTKEKIRRKQMLENDIYEKSKMLNNLKVQLKEINLNIKENH